MNRTQTTGVLAVDDNEDNRFLVGEYCRGTYYKVTFAEDGEQAVAAVQRAAFDIIIMDIQMPVMDGLMATRLIRQAERESGHGRVPIVALTANVRPEDFAATAAAGCDAHLGKPVSRRALLNELDRWRARLGE